MGWVWTNDDGTATSAESGTTLPESPTEGDIYYKTDENRLYVYIEEEE